MTHLPFTGPQLPQELRDKIIGLLDHREELVSCALTARSFVIATQSRLFNDISIFHHMQATESPCTDEEYRARVQAAFKRLGEVLTESPHLKRYIRSASIMADLQVVVLFSNIGLPSLRYLELHSYDDIEGLDGDVLEPLQRLIGLASMRQLKICAPFSPQIFRDHTPYLTELAFDSAPAPNDLEIEDFIPDNPRTVVEVLRLSDSPDVADWLIDEDCPFDFTQLRSVVVLVSMTDSVRVLLAASKQTIRSLMLGSADIMLHPLDLSQFPTLNYVYLLVSSLWNIVDLLPSISELNGVNVIATIVFELEESFHTLDSEGLANLEANLPQFDGALNRLPLPALKKVVVLLPPLTGRDKYMEAETALKRMLPLLVRRQLLHLKVKCE
ncbi:hypothetical protein C8R44DRAFT_122599 [Mycena epipterygia]|nr:hypothetical protein C8R44DRAFT_122599 [Mycena epipterygia]